MAEDTECLYSVMECKRTDVHGALGSADTSQVASHFQKESSINHHFRPSSSTLTWGPREKGRNSRGTVTLSGYPSPVCLWHPGLPFSHDPSVEHLGQ